MRWATLTLAALLALAAVLAPAAAAPRSPTLLGFADAKLVRVSPTRLRPLPGRGVTVGSGGCAERQGGSACWTLPPWTFSPDRTLLAVARNDASALRLVDARRLRVSAEVRLEGGAVGALAWLAPGRVLAVQEAGSERQRLVAADVTRRHVVARRALRGSVVRVARTRRELVLLLAPARAIGAARIAVADRRGGVRSVRLPRIRAGSRLLAAGADYRVESRTPGLAVDAPGRRAFVVARSLAAAVDLRTLAVSYHPLERPASPVARLPAAAAKQMSGYTRLAHWLGEGLFAVSGADVERARTQSAGLAIVDTRSWSVRPIDRVTSHVFVARELLLATGSGIAAYRFDGERRFHLFAGQSAWPELIHGGRVYVGVEGQKTLRVVELASGRVVGERRGRLPRLVQGVAGGWWDG